jgi:hypothetical protein
MNTVDLFTENTFVFGTKIFLFDDSISFLFIFKPTKLNIKSLIRSWHKFIELVFGHLLFNEERTIKRKDDS